MVCHGRKEANVLFNNSLNTFYLRLYGIRYMLNDHSDSEKGNPLPPHGLLFPIKVCHGDIIVNWITTKVSFCFFQHCEGVSEHCYICRAARQYVHEEIPAVEMARKV